MTAMFCDIGNEARALLTHLKAEHGDDAGTKMFQEHHLPKLNSFALGAACRMYRLLCERYDKVVQASCQSRPNVFVIWDVVVIPGTEPGYVRCFPNLPAPSRNFYRPDFMCKVTPLSYDKIYHNFWKNLQADLSDPKKAKGWETNFRAWKRISKSETMTVQRAMRKYASVKVGPKWQRASDIPDHMVRDIGGTIADAFMPPRVVWCESPEDWTEMYDSSGPESCMTIGNDAHPSFEFLKREFGICPASFYHYHPYAEGVYLKERGKVTARAVVYREPLKDGSEAKWWGRIYASSGRAEDHLREELQRKGYCNYRDLPNVPNHDYRGNCGTYAEFEVPVYHAKRHKGVIPVPHLDNMEVPINGEHDKERDVVKIKMPCAHEDSNILSGTQGFFYLVMLSNVRCGHCHSLIRDPRRTVAPHDSHEMFCHPEHAQREGFVAALQNDGTHVWQRKEVSVADAINPREWFTNTEAARSLGALPLAPSVTELPEEGALTRCGMRIRQKDTDNVFCVNEDEYRKARDLYGSDAFKKKTGPQGEIEIEFDMSLLGKVDVTLNRRGKVVIYNKDAPLFEAHGTLAWLPDNWEELMPKGYNHPDMVKFDAGICKVTQAPVADAERHAFQFAA